MAKKKSVKKKKASASGAGEKNHSMLKEALLDLDKELSSLSGEKSTLEKNIHKLDFDVVQAREMEKELQRKISDLLEKEAVMTEKKKNVQTRMDRIADKLGKVKKIREDLENL